MQSLSEGQRDREEKGWKGEGSSFDTNKKRDCQPSPLGLDSQSL